MDCSTPGFPVLHCLPEFAQTHVHWVGGAIQPCHLLLPLLGPSIFPSIKVFFNESALYIRWLKYWNFSFNITHSSEHPGLIFFRIDWLDLLVVEGTLKSLFQHLVQKLMVTYLSWFTWYILIKVHVFLGMKAIQSSVCCSTIRKRNTAL